MRPPDWLPVILRRWRLLSLTVGGNLVEAVLVLGFAPRADLTLSPQASSIGPFGVFHDLRWMSVYSNSWWSPAEIAGILALRALFMAAWVRWAWPDDAMRANGVSPFPPRPSWLRLWGRGSVASGVLALFLWPSAAVLFASAVVPVSWLFIAAVPAAVFVSVVVQPVPIGPGWWRRALPLRAIGWALLSFLVATLAGLVVSAAPSAPEVAVAAAVLAGVFNAWAWDGTVRAVVRPVSRPDRIRPVVPLALAALVGGVAAGAFSGFSQARETAIHSTRAQDVHASALNEGPPVLIVDGYGSSWNGVADHPIPGAWSEVRFSYRGYDQNGAPLSYKGVDTVKPLKSLVRLMALQVTQLSGPDHESVKIVAESEGAIVVEAYLHATARVPVSAAVLLSPLLTSAAVTYPTGGTSGWGQAGEWGMSVLSSAFQSSAPINLSPDNRFLRSIVADGPLLRRLDSCPVAGVRQVGLLSLADAVGVPPHLRTAFPTIVLPVFHGGMLQRRSVEHKIALLLADQPVRGDGALRALASAVSWAASSWQVPNLPDSYFDHATTALARGRCDAIDAGLGSLVWGAEPR